MSAPDEALNAAAAADVVELYTRHADAWAASRLAVVPDELEHLEWFADQVRSGGTVLDLGCGSGRPVAALLIQRGLHVTGIDASPGLIDRCRRDFPGQEWIVSDMRGLDLGRTFDGVLAWYSAFHLTPGQQAAMAAVYARHLKPGGRVTFIGGPRRGVAMGEWMGRALYHASLAPTEYRAGLTAAGLADIEERVMSPANDQGARVWTARRAVSD